tara:strand:+ start:128 stop:307 length:180 start_codon:yes stop_codon:yes gene_type:complete
MQKPAAINITKKPWTRKEKEFKIYAVSASGDAFATPIILKTTAGIKINNLIKLVIIILR